MNTAAKNKLIVALDVESAKRARELVNILRDLVGMFKIGSQLFTAAGPEIVREVVKSGGRVFLDLKYHDIPNTVAAAGVAATRLGVSIFNVHAAGGGEMMQRTADAVSQVVSTEGLDRPSVIAVTVLTSIDGAMLSQIGVHSTPEDHVRTLALLAEASGMDGVVASPREVSLVRANVKKAAFLIVTPGVRPAAAFPDDQKRLATPAQAMKAGADYLVVGRPITAASDPALAAQQIAQEMEFCFA
jgi:orotidine-5'-phosphate decarboxylase